MLLKIESPVDDICKSLQTLDNPCTTESLHKHVWMSLISGASNSISQKHHLLNLLQIKQSMNNDFSCCWGTLMPFLSHDQLATILLKTYQWMTITITVKVRSVLIVLDRSEQRANRAFHATYSVYHMKWLIVHVHKINWQVQTSIHRHTLVNIQV